MADLKTERLINLTLALLSAKRYLKKQDIFRIVEGYEGTFESMDRMFERDKADLRNLGINIEVGELDPLFEDEPGYRIRESDYYLNLPDFSATDFALIAMACEMWRSEGKNSEVQSFVTKMHSLEIPIDQKAFQEINFQMRALPKYFDSILRAIKEGRRIKFRYRQDLTIREIETYRIFVWQGSWYLIGKDTRISEIRTFKLDRIKELVEIGKKAASFQIPDSFDPKDFLPKGGDLEKALLRVNKDEAKLIRQMGRIKEEHETFDVIEISFKSKSSIVKALLWHGSSIEVISPKDLRDEIQINLEELLHG
jgi:proteasome accessory factor B